MVVQLQSGRIANYNYARFYHDDACVSMIIAFFRLPALLISSRVDLSPRCTNLNLLLVHIGQCLDVRFHSKMCLTGYQIIDSKWSLSVGTDAI